jgi:hypothetical protein
VHYWQHVAERAARRNAHHEAIAALHTGVTLLATLPDNPERIQGELALQLALRKDHCVTDTLSQVFRGVCSREDEIAGDNNHLG